jgi:hypothetical protein
MNISAGVICLMLLLAGGNAVSVFAAQRETPWLPSHEQGEVNVTTGFAWVVEKVAKKIIKPKPTSRGVDRSSKFPIKQSL